MGKYSQDCLQTPLPLGPYSLLSFWLNWHPWRGQYREHALARKPVYPAPLVFTSHCKFICWQLVYNISPLSRRVLAGPLAPTALLTVMSKAFFLTANWSWRLSETELNWAAGTGSRGKVTSQGQKARTLKNRDTKFFNLRATLLPQHYCVSRGKVLVTNSFVFINRRPLGF